MAERVHILSISLENENLVFRHQVQSGGKLPIKSVIPYCRLGTVRFSDLKHEACDRVAAFANFDSVRTVEKLRPERSPVHSDRHACNFLVLPAEEAHLPSGLGPIYFKANLRPWQAGIGFDRDVDCVGFSCLWVSYCIPDAQFCRL